MQETKEPEEIAGEIIWVTTIIIIDVHFKGKVINLEENDYLSFMNYNITEL